MAKPGWVERSVSKQKIIVLGVDLNEYVGEGNIGDEEIMGSYVTGKRNKEGLMVVDGGWIWRFSTLISRKKTNTG